MTTLQQTGDDCQTNDSNNLFPIALESLRFPLDSSMRIVFTGYFNGFNVEIRSIDEMTLLYHMGCFGKGSASRSKPKVSDRNKSPTIMRKRQFLIRNFWHKKFVSRKEISDSDMFLKEIDELAAKIISDSAKQSNRDVIDLVSSDENSTESNIDTVDNTVSFHGKEDIVVIVPNSDLEEDNYFANLRPKCCMNKIKIQEKLMLTLQEAFFLSFALGCLQIVDIDNRLLTIEQCWQHFIENDKHFTAKYVVYHYFRSKGYVVKPGLKFGGDYLLYKEGPEVTHADFIVVLKCEEGIGTFDWISVLGHVRMATTTAKGILIAEVIKPSGDRPKLPEGLSAYSVREILLTRKMPVTINEDTTVD